jgi:cobyrinic acid a,c-diamide synthase
METPKRIIIAALKGGSGKTMLSLGITAALKKRFQNVGVFKKGPDYIDAGWLALAAGQPCYNLDNFLIHEHILKSSFISHAKQNDISVIEGNRGIFDGLNEDGETSTAGLARLLDTPVLLCIDCTKATRTIAAIINGILNFESDIKIKGVILNKIAGPRHESVLRKSIEKYCNIKIIGAIPKLKKEILPERHMGLVPTPEHEWARSSIEKAGQTAEKYLDIEAIINIAKQASSLSSEEKGRGERHLAPAKLKGKKPKIGIIKDSAFQFYYPENIEALSKKGADIIFLSPLKKNNDFNIDGLYIGGGFPETHAKALADNIDFKKKVKEFADNYMPIYAECGGLMYLGRSIKINNEIFPMADVLPIKYSFSKKPQGHGYTIIKVVNKNPYFKIGEEIKGHEFHYSKVDKWEGRYEDLAFSMKKGIGIINKMDAALYKNVLGTYTHIHALSSALWAESFVKLAINFQQNKSIL